MLLKPAAGNRSKGIQLVHNREELKFYLEKDNTLLILEYLPGKEYTVDCFTDRNRKLLFVGPRERARVFNGISVNTKPVDKEEFVEIAEKINATIKLRGAWFFQVKRNRNSKLSLLEIAPRIAGTMSLYRNLGVNYPLLSVFDAFDIDVLVNPNKYDIELDRALFTRFKLGLKYDYVYIDLDDTIVFRNKINPQIIAFLYQAFNEGKKLILLTRHDGELKEYLQKYRLSEIFDEIIHLNKEELKSKYVKTKNAIYVDDSYAERTEVQTNATIPVFDPTSIESLINWKY